MQPSTFHMRRKPLRSLVRVGRCLVRRPRSPPSPPMSPASTAGDVPSSASAPTASAAEDGNDAVTNGDENLVEDSAGSECKS